MSCAAWFDQVQVDSEGVHAAAPRGFLAGRAEPGSVRGDDEAVVHAPIMAAVADRLD